MTLTDYIKLKHEVIERGYLKEILWYTQLKSCSNADDFAAQAIWVILASGMKEQIARIIEKRVWIAINDGKNISTVFRHPGKVMAIEHIWNKREQLFQKYCEISQSSDKLEFLESLPWIGKITKYHLAKNLGAEVCKPDRHLVRIAAEYGTDPNSLCHKLAEESQDRVTVVDVVLWRAANLGMI